MEEVDALAYLDNFFRFDLIWNRADEYGKCLEETDNRSRTNV